MARKKQLTDLKIQRHKPKGGREILWDRDGLGILIGKRKKTWIFQYSFDGKRPMMKLGEYPAMSFESAHKAAAEAREKVGKGIDPAAEKKAEKAQHKAAPTFAEALEEFWQVELSAKKSGKDTKRLIEKDTLEPWGKRKVAGIKRRDIVVLLDEVRERGPVIANRLHGSLTRFFNFCAERGIIEDSPATRIKKTKEKGRKRVLTDGEIKALWPALAPENKAIDAYPTTKLALKIVLLTGQRPGEVAAMRWDELEPGGIWNNPAGKRGDDEPVQVPLTSLALEAIEAARAYTDGGPYVFPSSYKKGRPVTRASLGRAITRHWKELELDEVFTPHDLRRTLRTRLAELGVDDIVAEKVLGHQLQGMLRIYNRHDYSVEKRQALEKWEAKLRQIVKLDKPEGAQIIRLER